MKHKRPASPATFCPEDPVPTTSPLKVTTLNAAHRAPAREMVDFGGWDMPINYGSQIEEHHAVRRDAGMFDVSHMTVVDLHGARTRDFLRHLLANSVDKLKVQGKALYSCMLNEQGGVIDDLIVYFLGEDFFPPGRQCRHARQRSGVDRAAGEGVRRDSVQERPDFAMIAVQGPNARAKIVGAAARSRRGRIEKLGKFAALRRRVARHAAVHRAHRLHRRRRLRDHRAGSSRPRHCGSALAAAGVAPAGLGARDTLRLEAGMNLYGQDMDENLLPSRQRPRVDRRSQVTARLRWQGRAAGAAADPRHCSVSCWTIAAACCAPTRKCAPTQATARSPAARSRRRSGNPLRLHACHARLLLVRPCTCVVRDKALKARVVKPPFVRNGKVLVS